MKRMNKSRVAMLAGWIFAIAIFSGGAVGWYARGAALEAAFGSGTVAGNVVEVSFACNGWSESNVGLGAFVSGEMADGSAVDEQVTLDGPGAQEVSLPAGGYQVAPRVPCIMLEDGTVLSASDPVACWFADDEGGRKAVKLEYHAIDMALLGDVELTEIASDSFVDEELAARALELAKELRDAAPAPDLDTPDIDGETSGDMPDPLAATGGE